MTVEIGGVYMERSLKDFQRSCEVWIEEEQAAATPQTYRIALLCDAIRLTREVVRKDATICELTRRLIAANEELAQLRMRLAAVTQATP